MNGNFLDYITFLFKLYKITILKIELYADDILLIEFFPEELSFIRVNSYFIRVNSYLRYGGNPRKLIDRILKGFYSYRFLKFKNSHTDMRLNIIEKEWLALHTDKK